MGRTVIKTLTARKTAKLPSGSGFTSQSFGLVTAGKCYVFCNTHQADGAANHVLQVSLTDYKDLGKKIQSGHVNGGTYCAKNGLCYTTTYGGSRANKKIAAWDPNDKWKKKFVVDLPVYATGIAYDPITTDFYISVGAYFYVFPYKAFSKGGKYSGSYKKYTKKFKDFQNQDIGGYGGIIMCCKSWDIHHSSNGSYTSYIDCYKASSGKYVGSWKTQGECESISVDNGGNLHVLYAGHGGRKLVLTNQNMSSIKEVTTTPSANAKPKTVSETALRNKVVKKAKSYVGQGGSHFWKYSGMTADWCVMFAKCIFNECGMGDVVPTKGSWVVSSWADEMRAKGIPEVKVSNAKPGDIVMYSSTKYAYAHVEIVTEKGNAKSCGGNTGSGNYSVTKVKNRYHGGVVKTVFRPPYSKSKAAGSVEGDSDFTSAEEVTAVFETHPEQLVSSQNYSYIMAEDSDAKDQANKEKSALYASLTRNMNNNVILDSPSNIKTIVTGVTLTSSSRPKTKVEGSVSGAQLPVALNPIEVPFIEMTLGGHTFGLRSADGYPNYINGLNVVRTNGSMNEYTLNLVHQVSPGRNPNFIDELLAANSYNKIQIKYGDANSNVVFIDSSALLTGSSVKFDFASSQISYAVRATSSVITTATHKLNYPAITDKPSNVIRTLINNSATGLAEAFPKMRDANFVSQNNLIPNNDSVVSLEGVSNINSLNYLKQLVAAMTSTTSTSSTYYLILQDDYFKIYEIDSANAAYDASVYEVNLNYPDDNQIFSFNADTDFAWPIAYNYSGDVTEYNYNIGTNGIETYHSTPALVDFTSSQKQSTNDNWWKQVTEFPTKATLECRGLLSPLLLMTYIKVNVLYYGQERLTSGVYIVTGQEDILTGAGYRTRLSLLRVAGPQQHLTTDGRVRT